MKKNLFLSAILFLLVQFSARSQCVANFNYTVDTSLIPVTVFFVNTSTGTGPLTYTWNFGDGSTDSMSSPVHAYLFPGNYLVSLIIQDGSPCMDSINMMITITAPVS